MGITFRIVFETQDLFSGFIRSPPAVEFAQALRGSRSCPGPGAAPAAVIWNQFDPLTVKMPRLPPVLDSIWRLRGHGAVWY